MQQDYWDELARTAEAEVAAVMAELPDPVRQRILDLPVTFEPQPNPEMVAGGIHPDRTLGLFTGVPYPAAIAVSQRLPPQIILFLENIWNYAGHDRTVFAEQVRITLLHEIGHYLGLDERGVRTRGCSDGASRSSAIHPPDGEVQHGRKAHPRHVGPQQDS